MTYQVRSTAKRHIVEHHGDVVAEIASCVDQSEAINIAYLLNNQPNMFLGSVRDELVTALSALMAALEDKAEGVELDCLGPRVPLIELLDTVSTKPVVDAARATLAKAKGD